MTGSSMKRQSDWRPFSAASCVAPAVAAVGCLVLALAMQTSRGALAAAAADDTPQALVAKGEYQKAAAAAEAILSRSPDRSDAMTSLLDVMIATGEYRKAAERGEEFLKRKPDD